MVTTFIHHTSPKNWLEQRNPCSVKKDGLSFSLTIVLLLGFNDSVAVVLESPEIYRRYFMRVQYRCWAKCLFVCLGFFWGGEGGRPGEKSLKIFELFISEIAANASNFKI